MESRLMLYQLSSRIGTGCMMFIFTMLLWSCSFHTAPTVTPERIPPVTPPIPRSLTLLITDEFANYVLQGSQDNREFRYDLGPGAVAALTELLRASFQSLEVRRVPGEAMALLQLTGQAAQAPQTDFTALAKFPGGAGTYVRPFAAGLEIRIQLDVVNRTRTVANTLAGVGRGSAGVYLGSAITAAGNQALEGAILTLRDSLQSRRSEF